MKSDCSLFFLRITQALKPSLSRTARRSSANAAIERLPSMGTREERDRPLRRSRKTCTGCIRWEDVVELESDVGEPETVLSETSSVASDEWEAVETESNTSNPEVEHLREALAGLKSEVETLKGRLQAAQGGMAGLESALAAQKAETKVGGASL